MMDDLERREFNRLLAQAEDNVRNDWEQGFIDDLDEQSENPFWSPTDRQWEKLEQIADR